MPCTVFKGDLDTALEYADRALRLNPNSARAHALKGGILMWSGDFSQGRDEAAISSAAAIG